MPCSLTDPKLHRPLRPCLALFKGRLLLFCQTVDFLKKETQSLLLKTPDGEGVKSLRGAEDDVENDEGDFTTSSPLKSIVVVVDFTVTSRQGLESSQNVDERLCAR